MKNKTLEVYLQKRGYATDTIHQIIRSLNHFSRWLEQHDYRTNQITKSVAVDYIDWLKENCNQQPITINLKVSHLRMYFQLVDAKRNPFSHLKVRGERKRIHPVHLPNDDLQFIYRSLPQSTEEERRAKILAGFYLFQGAATRDVEYLRVDSLDLNAAELKIPTTRRANGRTLPLHPLQMRLLFECAERVSNHPESYLYIALGRSNCIRWVIKHMQRQLVKTAEYHSLVHLRYSVIKNWYKTNNLRQVQYNAGHRYISTTEKLLEADYDELKLAVLKMHPMG
jgi:integrase/recombinase XerD